MWMTLLSSSEVRWMPHQGVVLVYKTYVRYWYEVCCEHNFTLAGYTFILQAS